MLKELGVNPRLDIARDIKVISTLLIVQILIATECRRSYALYVLLARNAQSVL